MNPQLTCILVDDEPKARQVLSSLIKLYCPELEVLQQCEDLNEARIALLEHQPQIVFLDIHLPGSSGFDLIGNLKNRNFALVFTTAYEEHAVKAFDHSAQDYLMKPIHSERLIAAVKKCKQYLELRKPGRNQTKEEDTNPNRGKVALPSSKGFELYDPEEIVRFQGSGSYTEVYLRDGKELMLSQNLKKTEELLVGMGFLRIHRSHVVNLRFVRSFSYEDGGTIVLMDGTVLEVARRKVSAFKEAFGLRAPDPQSGGKTDKGKG